jgi:hypothetical protein
MNQLSWLDTDGSPQEIPVLPDIVVVKHRVSLPEPRRSSVKPLSDDEDVCAPLATLPIGALLPLNVRIYDTNTGTIPPWMLWEREECERFVQVLTIVDASTFHDHINTVTGEVTLRVVACDVFTALAKTLAGEMYTWFVGCERARGRLGDIRQHARQISEREEFDETEEVSA